MTGKAHLEQKESSGHRFVGRLRTSAKLAGYTRVLVDRYDSGSKNAARGELD
jgi:hypothetical protein